MLKPRLKPVKKRPELSLRARALQYLARREYSRAELRSKLQVYIQSDTVFEIDSQEDSNAQHFSATENGVTELNVLLDDLTERGWLSDARAATQLVHAKRSRFGTQRITHELRQRGIAEDLISAALPALKESELETAYNVWLKKFATLPLNTKEKLRQIRFLQSRGFSMAVIIKILKSSELHD